MKRSSVLKRVGILSFAGLIASVSPFDCVFAAEDGGQTGAPGASTYDLGRLSLEELGNIVVTSVSKKPESLSDAAASIYVITRDDMRRSGATSLPEALRLAPNLEVAQFSASGYAISARGFNSNSANKLLVLIDGRTVYSPLFSGVFWDVQDLMLEDVERIEVVSGPGGTLWGVNAVNGVINVITRSAQDTQGGLATTGIGNRERDSSVRYGGTADEGISYRVYAKTFDRDHTVAADGSPVDDGWHQSQAGFRVDWNRPGDRVTLQGDAYDGAEGQPAPGEVSVSGVTIPRGPVLTSGGNLTAHWDHILDSGSQLSVVSYFDRTSRNVNPTFADTLNTFDLQITQSFAPFGTQNVNWGAEYRHGDDYVASGRYFAFLPAKLEQTWASIFAQDEMALTPNLKLSGGVRLERNDYTGNEVLPNLRLAWKVSDTDLLWSALSRTVRAPSRLDRDAYIPAAPPFQLAGGPQFISEVAKVLEIGYRGQATRSLTYSATVFYSAYDHLRTATLGPSGRNAVFANGAEGRTAGVEMWGNYQAATFWRLSAGFSALRENLQFYPGSGLQFPQVYQGPDPAQWWSLRSSFDLSGQTELDVTVRHVGALSSPVVPAYTVASVRLGWTPRRNVEFSLVAQNLLGSAHGEFNDVAYRTEFARSVYVKFVGRF
ncbi:MAG TPA: TonB-dependent receptor [Burkholderiaceae bacterium]